jgi:hypothetical protein
MAKYNWETIKRQYIQGIKKEDGNKTYPSYEDLSELHGPSKSTISSHSTSDPDGPWEEQRERYLKKVEQKVEEKKSEIEAENIVEDDLQCESLGRKLIKIIGKKLDLLEKKLDADEWVSGIEILNTSSAARNAQEIIKTSQGEAANIQQIQGKIEGRYSVTMSLICSDEHIEHEKRVLNDVGKAQGITD